MSPSRSRRRSRGIVTGLLALGVGALLLWHGLLPNIAGSASLFETFLPWLGVVILVLGLAALIRLSLFGALCVAAAAAAWAFVFVPSLLPGMRAGSPSLTVVSENIHADNAAAADIAKDIASREPDVIALQELDATSREAVSEVLDAAYPHSEIVGTVGVWSTIAITDQKRLDLGLGWDRALWVDLDTPGLPTRLYAVHLASVRPGQYEQRDTMLGELTKTLEADSSSRVVVVGDFNSASTDREFTPLLSVVTEAPDSDLGFGFTWPAEFPVARLDHALVRGLTTVSSTVLPGNGSDHRGISVGLR
ncbi:endonuclease/exonuclease/phosphatase family protein [Leifsonia poae]|uniref:endonuclease/exonuclease/phosphatase family protein n=1 Tax=Leifsonia poae TaxID=110933 RepID=UPI001CC0FDA8|nr:endonuclease/exonuclease/phosphatase family protein [Leifsonia poae]